MISFFSYLIYKIVKIFNSKKIVGEPKNGKILSFILAIFLIITGSSGFQKNPFNPKKSFFTKSDIMANHLAVNSIQNYTNKVSTTADRRSPGYVTFSSRNDLRTIYVR